jgi:hypothetical protein
LLVYNGNLWIPINKVLKDDGFENYSTGSIPSVYEVNGTNSSEVTSTHAEEGSQSILVDYDVSNGDDEYNPTTGNFSYLVQRVYVGSGRPNEIQLYMREPSSGRGGVVWWEDQNGNIPFVVGTANPEWSVVHDKADNISIIDDTGRYDEWLKFTITPNWQNNKFDVELSTNASDTGGSLSGLNFIDGAGSINKTRIGVGGEYRSTLPNGLGGETYNGTRFYVDEIRFY